MVFLFVILIILVLALFPSRALAWGPGVHIVTGNWVIQNIGTLGLPMGAVILQHPKQFLHGLLSADIFIGKGCKATDGHSHNWESGFQLLDRARDEHEQAFAYGYLSHLAEDIVAHNVFVPGLLHTLPNAGKIAHIYLEAQADRLLTWESADLLGLFKGDQSRVTSALLSDALRQKAFSFWIKKQLFQGGIYLGGSRLWKSSMRLLDAYMPENGRGTLLEQMLTLSTMAMVNFLRHGRDSILVNLDPIGEEALVNAQIEEKSQSGGFCQYLPWMRDDHLTTGREIKIVLPPALESLSLDIRPEWPMLK